MQFTNSTIQKLTTYYQNCNGLRSARKMNSYKNAIIENDYDVLAFVETNLDSSVRDLEIFTDDYVVFRHDRILSRTPRTSGGGVLVALRRAYSSRICELPESADVYVEMLCVCIEIRDDKRLFIVLVYVPHWNHSVAVFEHIGHCVSSIQSDMNQHDEMLLLGDFNLTNLGWIPDEVLQNVYYPSNVTTSVEAAAIGNLLSIVSDLRSPES